jgi:hypothetical protein
MDLPLSDASGKMFLMRFDSGLNLALVFLPRKLRTAIVLFGVAATLWFGTRPDCRAARPHRDYLVPVTKPLGSRAAYEELWQQKLLVTPGEIARFVGLPGTGGVETTVSVYRAPGKEGSLPGDYWMTATQASESLWNCVEPGTKDQVDPNAIAVERCDAPIPESTALTVHKSWLTMLSQSRPQHDSRVIPVDSSREIFSAVDADGRILQGESSTAPKKNTKALINIALSLLEYCGADAHSRTTIATDIEKAASNLLDRVASSRGSKKQNTKSTSSSSKAVTPPRQNISQPTSNENPAQIQSMTRLGASISDFVSILGPPSDEETIFRTASLKWKRQRANANSIVPDVFAVEVAFLDGVACEIALRSKRRITPYRLVKLTEPFLTTSDNSNFVKPELKVSDLRTYMLSDGTSVWANKHRKHTIIVIRGSDYVLNEEVFNREAATVHPPTSNH